MLKEKSYTITDITDLYGLQRATLYYRFKNQYKDYVVTNEDGVQALNQEGMDKMIKEYNLELVTEQQETSDKVKVQEKDIKEDTKVPSEKELVNAGYSEEQVDKIVSALEQQLQDKEDEIKRLHNRMESLDENLKAALELNRNNQVLLLRSEDKVKELESRFEEQKEMAEEITEVHDGEKKKSFFSRLFRR